MTVSHEVEARLASHGLQIQREFGDKNNGRKILPPNMKEETTMNQHTETTPVTTETSSNGAALTPHPEVRSAEQNIARLLEIAEKQNSLTANAVKYGAVAVGAVAVGLVVMLASNAIINRGKGDLLEPAPVPGPLKK